MVYNIGGISAPSEISYSLLASLVRHIPLEESIQKMETIGISSIHYDISDDLITLDPVLSHALRSVSSLPFDYHIAQSLPDNTIKTIALRKNDFVCAHIEAKLDWLALSATAKDANANFGIGLNVDSGWEELLPYVEKFSPDYVLIMAAQAGKTGGSFNYQTFEKIYKLRSKLGDIRIHVDGGIDDLAAATLKGLGVQLLVSGSYLHSSEEQNLKLAFLRGLSEDTKLTDLINHESPKVRPNSSWQDILNSIEAGGIGCTAVIGDNNEFVGLITDNDLRKAFMKSSSFLELSASEICNKNAFTSNPFEDFWVLLIKMQRNAKMHTVVPLVDSSNQFYGIVKTQDILFNR